MNWQLIDSIGVVRGREGHLASVVWAGGAEDIDMVQSVCVCGRMRGWKERGGRWGGDLFEAPIFMSLIEKKLGGMEWWEGGANGV